MLLFYWFWTTGLWTVAIGGANKGHFLYLYRSRGGQGRKSLCSLATELFPAGVTPPAWATSSPWQVGVTPWESSMGLPNCFIKEPKGSGGLWWDFFQTLPLICISCDTTTFKSSIPLSFSLATSHIHIESIKLRGESSLVNYVKIENFITH